MRKVPIQIRVDQADLREWQRKAAEAGKSVSEWIRERCNQDAGLSGDNGVRLVRRRAVDACPTERIEAYRPIVEPQNPEADEVPEALEQKRKGKQCKHGVSKSWHCWQCGGLAVIE